MTSSKIFFILLAAVVFFSFYSPVHAQNNSSVNATVKLAVCGDSVVEGSEDCEGLDLNGQTCQSLGYAGGTLSCDIACSFDTSQCIAPSPTPTPSPTPMPSTTPTPAAQSDADESTETDSSTTDSQDSDVEDETAANETDAGLLDPVIRFLNLASESEEETTRKTLPPHIAVFDLTGSGKIERHELHDVISIWVQEWRHVLNFKLNLSHEEKEQVLPHIVEARKCDLNLDQDCNLYDFSILLHYVDNNDVLE
jgi:hypothetical protein